MAEKYFKNAFASLGDKEAVPDDSVNTLVSYQTGYTPEYELDPDTDPSGNYIGRQRMNQLFADITGNLKQWQDTGYPEFAADDGTGSPLSYTAGRIVELNGVYYRSNTTTNTAPPSAQWDVITLDELAAAISVSYDNSASGLAATDVQAAIDEIDSEIINVFAQQSLTSNGYQKLPFGLIIQWGRIVDAASLSNTLVNFPVSFTNSCFTVVSSQDLGAGGISSRDNIPQTHSVTNSLFYIQSNDVGGVSGLMSFSWVALGY